LPSVTLHLGQQQFRLPNAKSWNTLGLNDVIEEDPNTQRLQAPRGYVIDIPCLQTVTKVRAMSTPYERLDQAMKDFIEAYLQIQDELETKHGDDEDSVANGVTESIETAIESALEEHDISTGSMATILSNMTEALESLDPSAFDDDEEEDEEYEVEEITDDEIEDIDLEDGDEEYEDDDSDDADEDEEEDEEEYEEDEDDDD
jgi:hypothetical protein